MANTSTTPLGLAPVVKEILRLHVEWLLPQFAKLHEQTCARGLRKLEISFTTGMNPAGSKWSDHEAGI